MRSVFFYVVFAVAGIILSYVISGIVHDIFAIPRYRSLGETGRLGQVALVVLLLLPLIVAPVGVAILHNRRTPGRASWREIMGLSLAIGLMVLLLSSMCWIGMGAWFGLLQAPFLQIILFALVPPIVAGTLFALLFFVTLVILGARKSGEA
ncbi:hypothetical protein [Celeribacter sp. ULVN23_4]